MFYWSPVLDKKTQHFSHSSTLLNVHIQTYRFPVVGLYKDCNEQSRHTLRVSLSHVQWIKKNNNNKKNKLDVKMVEWLDEDGKNFSAENFLRKGLEAL